jgi:CheY-like chemotaxis protein
MSGEPVSILLVDDQPSKRLAYRAILQELGERPLVRPWGGSNPADTHLQPYCRRERKSPAAVADEGQR